MNSLKIALYEGLYPSPNLRYAMISMLGFGLTHLRATPAVGTPDRFVGVFLGLLGGTGEKILAGDGSTPSRAPNDTN